VTAKDVIREKQRVSRLLVAQAKKFEDARTCPGSTMTVDARAAWPCVT
jgi:hypothetical protein